MKNLKKEIEISKFSLIKSSKIISHKGFLFRASPRGFHIRIKRKDLEKNLKSNLSLHIIHNQDVTIYLSDINLKLDGIILKTKYIGKGIYEVFIQFFDNAPKYWCECIFDMFMSYPEGEFSRVYNPKTSLL